jgi:hypothetical protein
MKFKHKFLIAFSILILVNSLCFAEKGSAQTFDETKIYKYLKSEQSKKTGLVNSFFNTSDEELLNQASTYDQALAGLAFLILGDDKAASRILDFFNKTWSGNGFTNFYNTATGYPGVETTIHLGPNMWITILALQYTAATGDNKYLDLAKNIAIWAIKLNHKQGGIAMGPVADWGANWPEVYSSENNIDAHAVFNLLANYVTSIEDKNLLAAQMAGIEKFLKDITFGLNSYICVGSENPTIMASDIPALLVLAFRPAKFESLVGFSCDELLELAEKYFFTATDDIKGYEFTDEESRGKIGRPKMISLEWTAMISLAYFKMADYYNQFYELTSESKYKISADEYRNKAQNSIKNLDKKILTMAKDKIAYPYATKGYQQVFPFAPWWKTPKNGKDGRLAASLASTCWRLFLEKRFNPLELKVKTIK